MLFFFNYHFGGCLFGEIKIVFLSLVLSSLLIVQNLYFKYQIFNLTDVYLQVFLMPVV